MADTPTNQKTGKFPSSIKYIIGNEAAERFNYYGLRAILTTFMVAQFYNHSGSTDPDVVQAAEATANAKTHDFVAMTYLLPMFGGMVADWFWGKYKTILWLSIVYACGSVMVALSVDSEVMFTTSLMLIALGAGGIKPCVSANVGDQFDESNSHLISKAFDAFYASINAGSVLSILLIPYLKSHYGPTVAFGVPAIAMAIAVIFFWAGRNQYRRIPPPKFDSNRMVILLTAFFSLVASYVYFDKMLHRGIGPVLGAWAVLVLVLAFVFKKQWFAKPGNFIGINLYAMTNGGFGAAAKEYGEETVEGIKAVWRVLSVFAFIPVFWALWDQSQSEWVVQATKMDLNFMGITWEAEQISFVNAAFILAFIPLFSFVIFPFFNKIGLKVTPLRKIGVGFVLTAFSFVIIAIIQGWIDAGQTPNIGWQILAFVVLTAGEVLISITGLEYAYTQSPPSMKSTIMACWLITVTLGNLLVSVIQNNIKDGGFFAQFHGAGFFWLFVGICAATAVLFILISPRIKERSYIV
ncbi:MAG: oligopeptide:H+ symporter [Saprospiraceae bacterium]|nr:oligopeptide:H+ symporter [Saprospiraceae bacterium]MCB9343205.1 MFS transporter [Lewinellaceae bacterium]